MPPVPVMPPDLLVVLYAEPAMPFTALDVFTAALVAITAYYARQTRRLAQLTRATIDAARLTEDTQLRPHVHA
jgi:hypothetical protein